MSVLSFRHRHRRDPRRAWALDILRRHVDEDGHCVLCAELYAAAAPWPCPPARIALIYVGPFHVGPSKSGSDP